MQTPFYKYDVLLLKKTIRSAQEQAQVIPGARIHYALKANHNPEILKIIASCGLGADCVSGGEIREAIAAGIAPADIVFSGVGKSDEEITLALSEGIRCINAESAGELENIEAIAGKMNVRAGVALRVNPGVAAHTFPGVSTGAAEAKFGINIEKLPQAVEILKSSRNLSFAGLHFHIGSQILIMEDFRALCKVINRLLHWFGNIGLAVGSVNVGGGLGIDYDNPQEHPIPDFKSYFNTFAEELSLPEGTEFHCELGRSIVGQCAMLVTKCLYVKEGTTRRFVIVDAGMNDLLRPALYGARHKIINLSSTSPETLEYDVVGPVCESSDCFAENCSLPVVRRGDLLAILSAGAYGESMANTYNSRPLPGYEI